MKFIHAADIHLDSPLTGLAAYEDAPAERLRNATRDAFANLVTHAVDEAVDFVVIAGDLYDGDWKDYNTGRFFAREMGRLDKAGIPVYLLFGNHDAESETTKRLTLPDNVFKFGHRKAETFKIDSLKVALHGQSFRDAAVTDNLAVLYPPPVAGWLNVGVLHTALEGKTPHANYAPCSLKELSAKGYQYWALGHVHEHVIHSCDPDPWVVFPGNLQGRHIRETGPRGAMMVSAQADCITSVERLVVDVLRWHRLDVDVSGISTLHDIVALIGRRFQEAIDSVADGRPLAIRVSVFGKTAAHGELFGREKLLREEILAKAALIGADRIWVEKVKIATAPELEASVLSARADALSELQVLLGEAQNDEYLLKEITEELQYLVNTAPPELTKCIDSFADIKEGNVSSLIDETIPSLLAHLDHGTSS